MNFVTKITLGASFGVALTTLGAIGTVDSISHGNLLNEATVADEFNNAAS